MKIVLVYQYFGTPKGSWSTRIYELTKRWVSKGCDVTVITSPYDKSDIKASGFISRQSIDGINLIIIDSGDSNRFMLIKRVFRSLLFSLISTYYAIFLSGDVLITSSGPITVGISGLFGKWFSKKKWVFEIRDLWPDGGIEMGLIKGKWVIKFASFFEKLIYRQADFIVTASDGQQQVLIEKGVSKNRIGIIYNASDNDLFGEVKSLTQVQKSTISGNKFFLHIGSLGFIHNVNYIIEAANHLKILNSNILVLLIGDGKERIDLEKKVNALKLNNVIFLGQMQKNEIVPWLSNCVGTLFCTLNFPVQNTCSPNKVFDSFAASKPVIQTTEGWIKDVFEKYECGINVHPERPIEMADAMIEYVDNYSKSVEHGQNAKKLALTKFSRDILAENYYQFLCKL